MVWFIAAGVLGVAISVTGGLYLRRLLGEITELRRQITGIDREMRAQRARVKFLRHLIDNDGRDEGATDDRPPDEAAVANGGIEHPPHAASEPGAGPGPVRRKKHLGLYLGGAVAALGTIAEAARSAIREHQGQVLGAITGAAVTATTVTVVTVQPWTTESRYKPPSSAPTADRSPTLWLPPPTVTPPQPTAPGEPPTASPSPSPSEAEPSADTSVSPTPSGTGSPSPTATSSVAPIGEESPPAQPEPSVPSGSGPPGGGSPSGEPDGDSPPPDDPAPPTPTGSPPPAAPSSAAPADALLCLGVALPPRLDADPCLLSL